MKQTVMRHTKRIRILSTIIGATLLLSGCNQDNTVSHLNGATKSQVCIALVDAYSSMNGDRNQAVNNGDMIRINQVRASDGKRFYYDCKINNDEITWRMNRIDGVMGPWKSAVKYSVSNGKIHIN